MRPIEHSEPQRLDATPAREPMRRRRRAAAVNHGGNLQTPSDAKHQRQMCYGMHLLSSHGHDVPPVVPRADSIIAHSSRIP